MSQKKEMFNIFFRTKPAKLILALKNQSKDRYGSVIAKSCNCTYSHVVRLLQEMEKAKLIQFEKAGRIKTVSLTNQGQKIAESIEKLKGLLRF